MVAILYGAMVSMVQPDLKKLIAYSSVSHMGFVMLGVFVFNTQGLQGAVFQMISHGVTTGALFLLVGVIYERTHDRQIAHMGGLNARAAALRGDLRAVHLRQHRPARAVGLHRRVPGRCSARSSTPAGWRRHDAGGDHQRRLHAVDVPARLLRRAVGLDAPLWPTLTDMTRNEWLSLAPLIVLVVALGVFPGPVLDAIARRSSGSSRPSTVARADLASACRGRRRRADGPLNDLFALLPELILTVLVLTVMTVDLFLPRQVKWLLTPLTVYGLVLVGVACIVVVGLQRDRLLRLLRVDDLSVFFKVATVVIGILAALFAPAYLIARRLPLGEFNVILLFSLTGMFVLASASDLITLFIGLELMVMPAYLLAGYHKTDRYSNEGGLKYFLLGSFASAILLFGISWTYGLTGTHPLSEIGGLRRPMRPGRAGGDRDADRRRDLQGGRGAVPLLDAGRLPGRADADHRLPVGRPQARRLRAAGAPLRRRPGRERPDWLR